MGDEMLKKNKSFEISVVTWYPSPVTEIKLYGVLGKLRVHNCL